MSSLAREKARNLLKELDTFSLPVDVRKIAKHKNVVLLESPGDGVNVSGALIRAKGHTLIAVNSDHSETRKRFTIAHELGHFSMHHKPVFIDNEDTTVIFRSDTKNRSEAEANTFAAELLMPSKYVKQDFNNLKESFLSNGKLTRLHIQAIISSLAEKYFVSKDAMKYQLMNLSLINEG